MIPNREFKLSELSLLTSSASEIDGVVDLKIVTNKLDWTLSRTGYLIGNSATNSNVTYQYNSGYIPVEEGNIVRLYFIVNIKSDSEYNFLHPQSQPNRAA